MENILSVFYYCLGAFYIFHQIFYSESVTLQITVLLISFQSTFIFPYLSALARTSLCLVNRVTEFLSVSYFFGGSIQVLF